MKALRYIVRSFVLAVGLVGLTSGASTPRGNDIDASHAAVFHCQYCNMTAENMHEFNNVDCEESGNGCKDCHVFNDCHNYEQSGTCDGSHDPCGASFAQAMETVRALLAEGEISAVSRLVVESDAVVWSGDRGVVQVLDCDGSVGYQEALDATAKDLLVHFLDEAEAARRE